MDLQPTRLSTGPSAGIEAGPPVITTPAGSTIQPVEGGGYQVCDAAQHCLRTPTLWQAQQLVQWAEVHHQPLLSDPAHVMSP